MLKKKWGWVRVNSSRLLHWCWEWIVASPKENGNTGLLKDALVSQQWDVIRISCSLKCTFSHSARRATWKDITDKSICKFSTPNYQPAPKMAWLQAIKESSSFAFVFSVGHGEAFQSRWPRTPPKETCSSLFFFSPYIFSPARGKHCSEQEQVCHHSWHKPIKL